MDLRQDKILIRESAYKFPYNVGVCASEANKAVLKSIIKSNKLNEAKQMDFYAASLNLLNENPEMARQLDNVIKKYCADLNGIAANLD